MAPSEYKSVTKFTRPGSSVYLVIKWLDKKWNNLKINMYK